MTIARVLLASFLILSTRLIEWGFSSTEGPVAWWKFDEQSGDQVSDAAGNSDTLAGYARFREGVSGSALEFDGFTTSVRRRSESAPQLGSAFTITGWVAPQAYPWNWVAIVNQEMGFTRGYFLGIDAEGYVGLSLAVGGKWQWCLSEEPIPFMQKWSHLAGSFDSNAGAAVYVDGALSAACATVGEPSYAPEAPLLIGRNLTWLPPAGLVREWLSIPTAYSFDGLLDELKIFDHALSGPEIAQEFRRTKPGRPALEWRRLPQLPEGTHPFGARYTKLEFYEEWDRLWKAAEHPDVLILFKDLPVRMVFWRGTNYNLNLVTENGRWVGDQSAENGSNWNLRDGPLGLYPTGCLEHMSDKQNRYSHVRVIENGPARVVVHWRYALTDVQYRIGNRDPLTGWGDWADEYYTIYPDGVAVRSAFIYGSDTGYSLTEPTVLNQPGEKAEDNIDIRAVTLANSRGESEVLSWEPWPRVEMRDAILAVLNLKSRFKAFYVFEEGTELGPYGASSEVRSGYSRFPTWNHWPVSQIPSDGRYALAPDRVSSSAILSPDPPITKASPGSPWRARFLLGLSDRPVEELLTLSRSWLSPPRVEIQRGGWSYEGYDRNQRAFLFRKNDPDASELPTMWSCSESSPILNPALVVRNWGARNVDLRMDGRQLRRAEDFEFFLRHETDGSDLILWLRAEATKPVTLRLSPSRD